MDCNAIKLIQDTAVVANGSPIPVTLGERITVIPESYKLLDLEPYNEQRSRFRGALSTNSIDSFGQYVNDNNFDGAQAFIDPEKFAATVFFNLGTVDDPGHADWTARLALRSTAAYDALVRANGQAFNQQSMVEFFEDWSHLIAASRNVPELPGQTYPSAPESISVAKLIAAVRRIKIKEGSETKTEVQQYAASQSRLDQVSAESDDGLPDLITFQCQPYHGLPVRTFSLRMGILTSGNAPALKLRIVGFEAEQEDMLSDFETLLCSKFAEGVKVHIGTFKA